MAQPFKVHSMVASRARATPVEGKRGRPTLADKHQEEEVRISTERRGFSFPQAKAAPAMEGEGGKLLARMSLEPGMYLPKNERLY